MFKTLTRKLSSYQDLIVGLAYLKDVHLLLSGSNYNVAVLFRPTNMPCATDPDCRAVNSLLGYPNEAGRIRYTKLL